VPGARRIDAPVGQLRSRLGLFALPQANVRVAVSLEQQSCIYVWGRPSHHQVRQRDLPAWCAAAVARQQFDLFRELLGTFVIVVDEPLKGRLTIVSDVLGIRPLFLTQQGSRFVFGSDVWTLFHAGLITPAVDYDAVGAWLAYGFNCTNGSLFEGVRRVPAGAAVVLERGRATTISYAPFEIDSRARTTEQAADDIHGIVSSDVETLLAEESRIVVPLSGGFDSRYLLALCKGHSAGIDVVNVRFSPQEGDVADRVADVLKVPVETLPVDRSVWDIYDEVHHFAADGFPISKFVTFCVAERFRNVPMVNGFMGDSLVRASNDRFAGKEEDDWRPDLAGALQQKYLAISTNLFRPEISSRILARSRLPMSDAVSRGGSKVFAWADLHLRQRHYISNNFLQHLDSSEAILPFYSWRLMAYKLAHAREAFSYQTYRRIFSRHFPLLAAVPHASELNTQRSQSPLAACSVRWARQLVRPLWTSDWLDLMSTPQCLSLVGLAASRLPSLNQRLAAIVEDAVFTCRRAYLLEQRARETHLKFEWGAL
jgi:hypothetical protein